MEDGGLYRLRKHTLEEINVPYIKREFEEDAGTGN
jgi:hypothetical protein